MKKIVPLCVCACLASLAVVSAAEKEPSPSLPFTEVSFETGDGGRIYANLYGEGDHAVVLAHGAVFNKESWDSLARNLAGEGYRVLAIDFRGYGKSKGGDEGGGMPDDILGAIAYLEAAGAGRVSVIGGSMGGGAAAEAAIRAREGAITCLILLAHPPVGEPDKLKGAKLFIVSEGDGLVSRVKDQYEKAKEPKKLIVLKGSAHAQHIFKTAEAENLTKAIVAWLGEAR